MELGQIALIIFEIASLVILLIARNFMSSYNEIWSKRFVVCAIFLIVWILVYDILFLFSYMESIYDLFIIGKEWCQLWKMRQKHYIWLQKY